MHVNFDLLGIGENLFAVAVTFVLFGFLQTFVCHLNLAVFEMEHHLAIQGAFEESLRTNENECAKTVCVERATALTHQINNIPTDLIRLLFGRMTRTSTGVYDLCIPFTPNGVLQFNGQT